MLRWVPGCVGQPVTTKVWALLHMIGPTFSVRTVTYESGGQQYIVLPAGGHTMYRSTMGDSIVAYKLKH